LRRIVACPQQRLRQGVRKSEKEETATTRCQNTNVSPQNEITGRLPARHSIKRGPLSLLGKKPIRSTRGKYLLLEGKTSKIETSKRRGREKNPRLS